MFSALLLLLLFGHAYAGEYTFVSWNILNFPGSTGSSREPDFRTILTDVGPDLLVVQEMLGQSGVNQFLANVLNTMEPGAWVAAPFHDSYDTDRALFYRDGAVEVLDSGWLDTALRDIEWWHLQFVDSGEEFRLFTCHLKASMGSTNEQKRLAECTILRSELDGLPTDLPFVLAGDLNIYSASEPAYQLLISAGPGQLLDPIGQTGNWHNNAGYAPIHTQSTRTTSFGGGATGGMDDRFDQTLTSDEMLDGSGLELLPGSYTAFGNDGAHFNQSIIAGGNAAVSEAVADALHNSSDHLPVVVTLSTSQATGVAEAVPAQRTLHAWPNPFNPTTKIHFAIPEAGPVSLAVHDVRGRLVSLLASGRYEAGEFEVSWDGRDAAGRQIGSGVYFVRMEAQNSASTQKLVLLK